MAQVTIPEEGRTLNDPDEIRAFLKPLGIWYEKWDVEGRVGSKATNEEILEAYRPEVERLKQQGGYQTADVIAVSPATPGLDEMCSKFAKEHTHNEDEVRFTIQGSGLFQIHPAQGPIFGITVESGDLINVPAGTRHWFNLCQDKTIRCIRLFLNPAGWAPHYVADPVHEEFPPVCWGPDYLPRAQDIDPVV